MKQIIAMGGGGFSMEPENPLLDRYILSQSKSDTPKICFIPTASGDADNYIERFYQFFKKEDCIPSHLSLFRPPTQDIREFILDKDIIYVGGGNTKNLLALWKEWELDQYLREAWENGIILAGISAGSLCWFEEGVTDSFGGALMPISCLGFISGSNCPHYDGEADRRPTYQEFVKSNQMKPGIAAEDGVAIHFVGDEIFKCVSSHEHSKAFSVQKVDEDFVEEELETNFLGVK